MIADGYKDTEIGVIPVEWKSIELGDIATFSKGKGISKNDISEDGVECIRYGELFTTYSEVIKNVISKTNSTKNMVYSKVNDTLMPTSDVTPTGLATASALNKEGVILGGDILIIRSEDILNSYLSYFIRSHKKQIMKLVSGSTVYHIYANDMKKLKIPLPPLKEQEKIADILSTADAKIDAIQIQIDKAETLKKGLLQKLLSEGIGHSEFKDSELGKIPLSWEVVSVEDITASHKQGYYTKDEYTGKGIYLIRITDLGNPKIDYSDMPKLPISDNDYKSFKVSKGDFLFARSGAIGRYGIVYEDYHAVFASYLIRFTFQQDKVINEYFGYFYETKKAINQLLSITQGSSNININANNIKSIKLVLPPLEEQKQIVEILSTADEKLEVLRAKKEKYETLKKGLLQKLLSGEVRV